ncbi:MAG: hypothetical protein INR62_04410 [Rhodospirillales bacterium]|nr:hypothetical protein [Acetobacter sp.]
MPRTPSRAWNAAALATPDPMHERLVARLGRMRFPIRAAAADCFVSGSFYLRRAVRLVSPEARR